MPSGRMPSVQANRFTMPPRQDVQRSAFSYAHQHKTTFNGGFMIPIYWEEVLPGDSFNVRMAAFARLSAPIVPVMDNLWFETAFFFVPHRLVWDNFKRFMGEKDSPTDTTEFVVPIVNVAPANTTPGTTFDYMGITFNAPSGASVGVSALPFRAINLVWNEFYRDPDLQVKLVVNKGDGPDTATDYIACPNIAKRHDYFTSARPWPERPLKTGLTGSLDGTLNSRPGQTYSWPVGQQSGAPVTGIGYSVGTTTNAGQTVLEAGGRQVAYGSTVSNARLLGDAHNISGTIYPNIRVMVNDIRTSVMIQNYMEKTARGGSRYIEIVREIFGVVSPDARLQRPEYLGGGRSMITVNPIAQTMPSPAAGNTQWTTKMGEQAGIGTISVYDHGFSQSFTEHGTILGFCYVRSDLTYQQGINRAWFRRTLFDFYTPQTAGLGEQAILRREIYNTGTPAEDQLVFGYQERWSEMKYKPSRTSGYFRSTVATPLDMWHFAEKFLNPPQLNAAFIVENAPIDRVLQSSINFGQQFLLDSLFNVRAVRPMPMYSIPGIGVRI